MLGWDGGHKRKGKQGWKRLYRFEGGLQAKTESKKQSGDMLVES